jgi:hypothetical protein
VIRWKIKDPDAEESKSPDMPDTGFTSWLISFFALAAESVLWILLGLALLALALTARWWLPWLRGSGGKRPAKAAAPINQSALLIPEVLPPDIIASARGLWAAGKPRHALALLYRASVETLSQRADVVLPPGATEAQCLRASLNMPLQADRQLFALMVRTWQHAAYAGRLPDETAFESLLDQLHQHYRWST